MITYANGVNILSTVSGSGTYGNANVATYLSRGNVTVGNITIQDEYDQQWQFRSGALIWPAGDGTPTGPYIEGSSLMTVYPENDGEFRIQTYSTTAVGSRQWKFTSEGNLIVPDDATIHSDLDLRMYAETGNIALGNQNGTWMFDNDGKLTAPGEVYGQFFTLRGGNGPGAEIGSLGYGGNVVTVHGYEGFNIETGPVESGPQWQFGTGGRLSLGANIGAIYADQNTGIVSIGDGIGPEGEPTAPSTVIAIGGNNHAFTISRYGDPYGQYWQFRANGETVFPQHGNVTISGTLTVGNLVVNGNSTVINTESYVVEDNIIQMANANPADSLDLGFVAHRTVAGNLQHTGLIRDASTGNWRLFSNVVPQPGNTVDFTNAVYDSLIIGGLGTTSISLTGPLNFTASPPAFSTPGIQWPSGWQGDIYGNTQVAAYLSANPQGSTYSNVNVEAYIGGNIGAFQIFSNANSATQATSINTINANLGAFQTYANATFGVSSYGNTQVAAYLLTYPNVNAATLNNTNGNIITLRAANFNSANAVISGGYISALTNVTVSTGNAGSWYAATINSTSGNIATLASTNFSTANAVISGGYIANTANITVTSGGNISGVGNIIGSTANTTITAGAYTSSFLSNGLVAIGGNLTVSGNNNNIVTKSSFIGTTGTATTLDNISANWNGGPAQFQIATVSGSVVAHWNIQTSFNGTFTVSSSSGTLTTSPTNFGGTSGTAGDAITVMLTDTTNGRFYRITGQIGNSYNNSPVIIERVI